MSNSANKVLAAVSTNGDIATIMGADDEMFGPYAPVLAFYRSYYTQYNSVPSIDVVNGKFPSASLEPVEGATAHFLNELNEEFLKGRVRELLNKADDILNKYPASQVIDKVISEHTKLMRYVVGAKDVDVMDPEMAKTIFHKRKEEIGNRGGTLGIKTGFLPIDLNMPTGLCGGQVIFVMGYSGKGKTYFANKFAINAWTQGYRGLFVSLEMTAEEQQVRFQTILGDGEYDMKEFATATIANDTFEEFIDRKIPNNPGLIVVDSGGVADVTPNMVQSKIDRFNPDFVIFDYMQLGMDNARSDNMVTRMMNLTNELKRLSTRNSIPIIAITAVSDEQGKNRDEPPAKSQIAWSRSMEYAAHSIWVVHRFDNTDRVVVLSRKMRNGSDFEMMFDVDFAHGVWTMVLE